MKREDTGARGPHTFGAILLALLLAAADVRGATDTPRATGARGDQGTSAVFRCADGQYSQSPCPGGRPLQLEPTPSAAQQREARALTQRQARAAQQMRRERLASEQAAARQPPLRIGPAAARASAPAERHVSTEKNDRTKPKKPKPRSDPLGRVPAPAERRAYVPSAPR